MKENKNKMNDVIQYIDSIITTINPGISVSIPEKHPYQKHSSEIDDSTQNYIELINKLQRHKKCSPSYCIHVNRKGQQVCKFGYPKEYSDHTFIRKDIHRQSEVFIKRNNSLINLHN